MRGREVTRNKYMTMIWLVRILLYSLSRHLFAALHIIRYMTIFLLHDSLSCDMLYATEDVT